MIVNFHIKSFNSLKRLLKQPKTFTMLQTPKNFSLFLNFTLYIPSLFNFKA